MRYKLANAPINVNLEGARKLGKGWDLNSKHFLWVLNALPQGHHNWSEENTFSTPPIKTKGQMCFIESKNIHVLSQLSLKCSGKIPAS